MPLAETKNLLQVVIVSLPTRSWRSSRAGTLRLGGLLLLRRLFLSQPAAGYLFGRACVLSPRNDNLPRVIVIHQAVDKLLRVLMVIIDAQKCHCTFIEFTKSISEEIVTALGQVVDVCVQYALCLVKLLLLCHPRRWVLHQVAILRVTAHAFLWWWSIIYTGCAWSVRCPSLHDFLTLNVIIIYSS